MNKKLLEIYRNDPKPYEQGEKMFWNDEHISKQMLKAHLDETLESASRTKKTIESSAKWIYSLAENKKNVDVLDLGCGPGLYAEQLTTFGCKVVGIDFSKRSIEYAKQSALNKHIQIDYRYENYLESVFNKPFDLAMMIYCDFGVLNPKERSDLLKKVYKGLTPNGVFVLDVFSEYNYKDFKENEMITYDDSGFWRSHPYVCIKKDREYNEVYLEQYTIVDDKDIKVYNLWNTAFNKKKLKDEFLKAGFNDISFFSDCTGAKDDEQSSTICIVARKK